MTEAPIMDSPLDFFNGKVPFTWTCWARIDALKEAQLIGVQSQRTNAFQHIYQFKVNNKPILRRVCVSKIKRNQKIYL